MRCKENEPILRFDGCTRLVHIITRFEIQLLTSFFCLVLSREKEIQFLTERFYISVFKEKGTIKILPFFSKSIKWLVFAVIYKYIDKNSHAFQKNDALIAWNLIFFLIFEVNPPFFPVSWIWKRTVKIASFNEVHSMF